MSIKLIVTDMDGTFLDGNSTFDREAFRLLKERCNKLDIKFVFCTGKQCERVSKILNGLEQDTYIVGDSATRIQINNENLYTQSFRRQLGLDVVKTIQHIDDDQTIIVCTSKCAYVLKGLSDTEKHIVHGSYEVVNYIDDFNEIEEDFLKITVHDAKAQCLERVNQLDNYRKDLYIVASEEEWIDITVKHVDKGTTIQYLQQYLGIDYNETIAFGDGLNDIDLFKAATTKVAMENAYPELKQHANLIARDYNHNGVIQTMNTLLDLQSKT